MKAKWISKVSSLYINLISKMCIWRRWWASRQFLARLLRRKHKNIHISLKSAWTEITYIFFKLISLFKWYIWIKSGRNLISGIEKLSINCFSRMSISVYLLSVIIFFLTIQNIYNWFVYSILDMVYQYVLRWIIYSVRNC